MGFVRSLIEFAHEWICAMLGLHQNQTMTRKNPGEGMQVRFVLIRRACIKSTKITILTLVLQDLDDL